MVPRLSSTVRSVRKRGNSMTALLESGGLRATRHNDHGGLVLASVAPGSSSLHVSASSAVSTFHRSFLHPRGSTRPAPPRFSTVCRRHPFVPDSPGPLQFDSARLPVRTNCTNTISTISVALSSSFSGRPGTPRTRTERPWRSCRSCAIFLETGTVPWQRESGHSRLIRWTSS